MGTILGSLPGKHLPETAPPPFPGTSGFSSPQIVLSLLHRRRGDTARSLWRCLCSRCRRWRRGSFLRGSFWRSFSGRRRPTSPHSCAASTGCLLVCVKRGVKKFGQGDGGGVRCGRSGVDMRGMANVGEGMCQHAVLKFGAEISRGQMRYRASGRIYGEFYCFGGFMDIVLAFRDFGAGNISSGNWVEKINVFGNRFLDKTYTRSLTLNNNSNLTTSNQYLNAFQSLP